VRKSNEGECLGIGYAEAALVSAVKFPKSHQDTNSNFNFLQTLRHDVQCFSVESYHLIGVARQTLSFRR